jgi:hypothetical protein
LEIELVPNGSIVTPFDFTPRTMRRVVDWFETADVGAGSNMLSFGRFQNAEGFAAALA